MGAQLGQPLRVKDNFATDDLNRRTEGFLKRGNGFLDILDMHRLKGDKEFLKREVMDILGVIVDVSWSHMHMIASLCRTQSLKTSLEWEGMVPLIWVVSQLKASAFQSGTERYNLQHTK